MSGHRKAALALHGLAPDDQQAVLEELPQEDQQILRGYLAELADLGFEGEAIGAVLEERPPSHPQEIVAQATSADVLRVLAEEPASLIVALLRVQRWPWEGAVLAALPPQIRLRVETQRAGTARIATARDDFVVRALAEALGSKRHTGPGVSAGRRLGNPFKRVMAWIR